MKLFYSILTPVYKFSNLPEYRPSHPTSRCREFLAMHRHKYRISRLIGRKITTEIGCQCTILITYCAIHTCYLNVIRYCTLGYTFRDHTFQHSTNISPTANVTYDFLIIVSLLIYSLKCYSQPFLLCQLPFLLFSDGWHGVAL